MNIVFVHGWASGPFVWDKVIDDFKEYNPTVLNLGFFEKENVKVTEGKFIGIGHSLGGLWLLKHYPERLSGFISIASFNCFYKDVPHQILDGMKSNIAKDMLKEISIFWDHAGLKKPQNLINLNTTKLILGLNWLSKWGANVPKNIPVKVLASKNDLIVTKRMTKSNWGEFDIQWIDEGGHMLPLTQPEFCIEHIKEFLHEFET